jgi:hypothetical protein
LRASARSTARIPPARILLGRQDRAEIIVDHRTAEGWREQVLHAGGELALPEFGLACSVSEVYRDTPLA